MVVNAESSDCSIRVFYESIRSRMIVSLSLDSIKLLIVSVALILTVSRAVQRATYSNIFDAYFILGIIAIEGISYLIAVTERMKVADIGIGL